MAMKYFVKLVNGVPSGGAVHEGSANLATSKTWAEVKVPAYPQDGYSHTLGPVTLVDGVYCAAWEARPDDSHAFRTQARALQIRQQRDALIKDIEWRYARHARNARTGAPQQDDLFTLDAYVQALADVTKQTGFPWDVQWPKYAP